MILLTIMETRRIYPIEDSDLPEEARFEAKFVAKVLGKEKFTQEEVRAYVQDILMYLDVMDMFDQEFYADEKGRNEQKRLLILDALRPDTMFNILSNLPKAPAGLSQQEIESWVAPVRQAIVQELEKYLSGDEFLLVSAPLNAWRTKENKVPLVKSVKSPADTTLVHREMRHMESDLRGYVIEACQHLMSVSEKNSHVVRIISCDSKTGDMVVEHRNIIDLEKLAIALDKKEDLSEKEKIAETWKLLQVVNDCLDGAAYLERNGLVLQDIKPGNLGMIVEESLDGHSGILFDVDGLIKKGAIRSTRLGTDEYVPPGLTGTVSGKEMSYQFGCVLDALYLSSKNFFIPEEKRGAFTELTNDLTDNDPSQRISVAEAEQRLTEILRVTKKEKKRKMPLAPFPEQRAM